MIAELDVWRAAKMLVDQHGDSAELEAARLADLMLTRARPRWAVGLDANHAGHHRPSGAAERSDALTLPHIVVALAIAVAAPAVDAGRDAGMA
jgi:hypothetical protein